MHTRVMVRHALAIAALLTVAAPVQAGLFNSAWDEAIEEIDKCNAAINKDPAFQPLYVKLAVGTPTRSPGERLVAVDDHLFRRI